MQKRRLYHVLLSVILAAAILCGGLSGGLLPGYAEDASEWQSLDPTLDKLDNLSATDIEALVGLTEQMNTAMFNNVLTADQKSNLNTTFGLDNDGFHSAIYQFDYIIKLGSKFSGYTGFWTAINNSPRDWAVDNNLDFLFTNTYNNLPPQFRSKIGSKNLTNDKLIALVNKLSALEFDQNLVPDQAQLQGILSYITENSDFTAADLENCGLTTANITMLFEKMNADDRQSLKTILTTMGNISDAPDAPVMVESYPAGGAVGVAVDSGVYAVFDQPIALVAPDAVTIQVSGSPLAGVGAAVDAADNKKLNISHPALANSATYTVTIPADTLQSVAGGAYNGTISWSFTTVEPSPYSLTVNTDKTAYDLNAPVKVIGVFKKDGGAVPVPDANIGLVLQVDGAPVNLAFAQIITGGQGDFAWDIPAGAITGAGSYKVKATANVIQAEAAFTVGQSTAVQVTVSPSPAALEVGHTAQLTVTTDPDGAAVTYASDNAGIATVSDTGMIAAIAAGSANITVIATKEGYTSGTAVVPVSVTNSNGDAVQLTVSPLTANLNVGGTAQLTVTTAPADAAVTYASDNTGVSTVSETGVITAVAAGSANITVTATKEGYTSGTAVVPVTVQLPAVQLTVSPLTANLKVGETAQLTVTTDPADAVLTYASDNTVIATVYENGLIKANATGSANITVTATKDGYTSGTKVVPVTVTTSSGGGGGGGGGGYTPSKPEIDQYEPAKDAKDVALAALVRVTFKEEVKSGDLTKVTIKDDQSKEVTGVIATVSGKALTIDHAKLSYGVKYTVSVPKGTVKRSDNSAENDVISWSFTTLKEPAPPEPTKCEFTDVPAAHWAAAHIKALCEKGIIAGYPGGTFKPDNNITRAEFAKIIAGALGLAAEKPAVPTFADVPSTSWSYPYVEAAAKAGLVKGENGKFRPDDFISRQEIAVILVRAMNKEDDALAKAGGMTKFEDDAQIGAWAKGHVIIAVAGGLINGYPDNTFGPVKKATRAEAAKMVDIFLKG